ncbi:hypothetical protein IQ07DRAFT_649804 [Pyrenochaeta sp. DS3sAY3a]|nr:hypothetical protein IQ07DRAFT_649804 [Pyrenochaeta sp. DS3sAY3a]
MTEERMEIPRLDLDKLEDTCEAMFTLRRKQTEQSVRTLESYILPPLGIMADLAKMVETERTTINAKILTQFNESNNQEKSQLVKELLLEAADPNIWRSFEESWRQSKMIQIRSLMRSSFASTIIQMKDMLSYAVEVFRKATENTAETDSANTKHP